jgi:hypothetical protein
MNVIIEHFGDAYQLFAFDESEIVGEFDTEAQAMDCIRANGLKLFHPILI